MQLRLQFLRSTITVIAFAAALFAATSIALAQSHSYQTSTTSTQSQSYTSGKQPDALIGTYLTGNQEVPPVSTNSYGAILVHKDDGTLSYALGIVNGRGITQAHFHCAPPGANGPVVVTLFHDESGQNVDGFLAADVISDGDIATTSQQCANTIGRALTTVSDLREAIERGLIYVNVHTKTHPPGEIRGQLPSRYGYGGEYATSTPPSSHGPGSMPGYGSGYGTTTATSTNGYGGHKDGDDSYDDGMRDRDYHSNWDRDGDTSVRSYGSQDNDRDDHQSHW